MEDKIEDKIEGELKERVIAAPREAVDALVAQVPDGLRIHRIVTTTDRLDITVCPAG